MTLNRTKSCFPRNNSALKRWITLSIYIYTHIYIYIYIHIYLSLLKTFFSSFKCYFLCINALPYNITQIILELLIISKYSVHSSYSCYLVKYSFFTILCCHMEHYIEKHNNHQLAHGSSILFLVFHCPVSTLIKHT